MAVVLDEPKAAACIGVLEAEQELVISAGTVAEALIVAGARNVGEEMQSLLSNLGFDILPVTASSATRVAQAYAQWGRRINPAGLNFGDCFAYEIAKQHNCRLLFIGDDFSRTDLESAL
jgi:ribonuclease VapC